MTLELVKGGYEKLDEAAQKIESLAWDGVYNDRDMRDMVLRFQQIASEARELRQSLKDIVLMVPNLEEMRDERISKQQQPELPTCAL